ncbi:MAG TPA: alpha/beta hydrolase [Polyangiaceae bacterium]|nr:alpha/beta hydrolase [Polyangiaceae bacterium]
MADPFAERHRIPTRAGAFAALAAGDAGAPLVLCLHGFPDTPYGFRGVMAALAEAGFRAVAPWARGYDPSPLEGPYDADRLGDDALALADALSPGRPVRLVGHDWGAVAAYAALAREPARFARAATLAVPHPQAFFEHLRRSPRQARRSAYMASLGLAPFAAARLQSDDYRPVDELWARWSPGFQPSDDYRRELKRCLRASMPAPIRYYRALFRPPAEALARASRPRPVRTPTLYLHGLRDGCVEARAAEGQARFFVGGLEECTLEGVGHFLHIERPDLVAERLVAWLRAG